MATDENKKKALEFLSSRSQQKKADEETKSRAISYLQNRSESGTASASDGKTPVIRQVRSSEDAKRATKQANQKPRAAVSQLVNKYQNMAQDMNTEYQVSQANKKTETAQKGVMDAAKRNSLYQSALSAAQTEKAQAATQQREEEQANAKKNAQLKKEAQARRMGVKIPEEEKVYPSGTVRTKDQSRAGDAFQSIGLSTLGSAVYAVDNVKQIAANQEAYEQTDIQERLADAYSNLNIVADEYGRSSDEYAAALEEYERIKADINTFKSDPARVVSDDTLGSRMLQTAQEKQAESMEGLTGVWRDLAEAGYSVADNLTLAALSGFNPAVTTALMSAKAGVGRSYELAQQGVSAGQALARGIAAGGIEYLTEKMGIDNLFDMVKYGQGNVLLSILKQGGIEGAEEIASYLLNFGADLLANDPNAEFDFKEMLRSGQLGAISGLMFGVGGTAINALGSYGTDTQTSTEQAAVEEAIELIRQGLDENGEYQAPAVVADNATGAEAAQTESPVSATENAQERTFAPDDKTVSRETNGQMAAESQESAVRDAETVAQDLRTVSRAATTLGENGSSALRAVYSDESVNGAYSAEDVIQGFTALYNQAQGKKLSATAQARANTMPDIVKSMAESAGLEDARRAKQAVYFGEKSGIVRDDNLKKANLSYKATRQLDALGKALGVQVRFTDSITDDAGNRAFGNYKDGVISVALDSENPVQSVVMHEAVHRLREVNSSSYEALSRFVLEHMSESHYEWNTRYTGELYGDSDVDAVSEEVVADAFGTILNDSGLLEQFAREHTTVLQRIADSIRDTIRKVNKAVSMEDLQLTDSEKRRFSDLASELAGMEKTMRNALRTVESQSARAYNEGSGGGEAKYSKKGYWKPELTQKEWNVLNRHMESEIGDTKHNLDDKTKYVYAQENGVTVFALYGIGDGTEATPLYVTRGKTAQNDYEIFRQYREAENNGADGNRQSFNGILKNIKSGRRRGITGLSSSQGRGRTVGDVQLSVRERGSDARRNTGESAGDRGSKGVLSESKSKFKLAAPVEESGDLVALHNLTEDKLLGDLRLGGFPMPSIAVTKASIPHTNFGNITLVMDKNSIDPKANKKNTVYSADAWTPTFPAVEYEVNTQAEKRVARTLNDLSGKIDDTFRDDLRKFRYGLEDQLNRYGGEDGLVQNALNNYGLKAAYLETQGKHIEKATTQRAIDQGFSNERAEKYQAVQNALDGMDAETILRTPMNELKSKYGDALEQAWPGMTKTSLRMSGILRQVANWLNNQNTGPVFETVTDTAAMKKAVDSALDNEGYHRWVKELFSGVEGSSGVYNNKDLYTPSGMRRSFKQTHYPVTLEGIVKSMAGQNGGNTKNVSGFYGVKSLRAGTAQRFKSIADMHKLEGRLQNLTQAEMDAVNDQLSDRMFSIMSRLSEKSPGSAENSLLKMDSIGNILVEIADMGTYTIDSIERVFNDEYGYRVDNGLAADVRNLLFDISQMPVNMFEAKPQRAVGFDEVLTAVIPSDSSTQLREGLEQAGVPMLEYEAGNESDRLAKVNSVENAKFSRSNKAALEEFIQKYGEAPEATEKAAMALLKENGQLREVNEGLKAQFKRTELKKVDKRRLNSLTKQLLKDYNSSVDIDDARTALDGLYTYLANGENGDSAVWESAYERAYAVAETILENSSVTNDAMYREYEALRKDIKNTAIAIDESYVHDLGYESLAEFRKANRGKIRLDKNGVPIDTLYQSLVADYPGLFDAEVWNPADQLGHIESVLDSLEPKTENPYASNLNEAASWLANDIIERFYDLPQAKPTYADKAQQKLDREKIRGQQKLDSQKARYETKLEQKNQTIRDMIAENRRKVQDTITAERMAAGRELAKQKQKYQEKAAKANEGQKARVLRERIQKHTSELSRKLLNPSDKAHIPEQLRKPVAQLLEAIDLESKGGKATARTLAFDELRRAYRDILQNESSQVTVDPDMEANLDQLMALKDTRISEMSSNDLQTVWKVLKSMEYSISTAGKTLASSKYERTAQWADALKEDTKTRKTRKGKLAEVQLDVETPYTFFSQYGEAGKAVYRMLRDAQDSQTVMTNDVAAQVQEIVDEKTVNALNREAHRFTTEGGKELTLTTAQIMDIYLLSKRQQALNHLLGGGIVQPDVKAKGAKVERGTSPVQLSMNDLNTITGKLTAEQKAIADKLQALTASTLAEYGNSASMEVYGYRKFTGLDYWPIRSAGESLHYNAEGSGKNARSIKNIGLAKTVNQYANNPVNVGSVFDVLSEHAGNMIDYAAWLGPMEDANRLFNYRYQTEDGDAYVKSLLDRVGGKKSQAYWKNLMEDIQNGIKARNDSNMDRVLSKMVGNVKGARVGANLRVVIQQPTAFFRAMDTLSPLAMAEGMRMRGGWKKALQYSPIAQKKALGGFDISSPVQMNDILFGTSSKMQKFNNAMGWGAEKADAFTWGKLWNACEVQTEWNRNDLAPGTDEFYSAVNELFTEVIDSSQVVDGVLQRSQAMRSSSDTMKQATAFMGEPLMSLNMMLRAVDNLRMETDSSKRGKALRGLGRAAASLAVTDIVNALAQSLIDAARDDDDDPYWEKFWKAFGVIDKDNDNTVLENIYSAWLEGNLLGNMSMIGRMPVAKDLISIAQGYTVERADMDAIDDIIGASKTLMKAMQGESNRTMTYAVENFAKKVGAVFGISAPNLLRDVWGITRSVAQGTGNIPLMYEMEKAIYKLDSSSNSTRFAEILYLARQNDREAYDYILNDMAENGVDVNSIRKKVSNYIKNDNFAKEESSSLTVPQLSAYSSDVENELQRLVEKTGDTSVSPGNAPKSFSVDGVEIELTQEEYDEYSTARYNTYGELVGKMLKAKDYQQMDDEAKVKAVRVAASYANEVAKADAVKDYSVSSWVADAQEAQKEYGISAAQFVCLRSKTSGIKSLKDKNGDTIENSKSLLIMEAVYDTPGLNEEQRKAMFEYLGVGKKVQNYNKTLVKEKLAKMRKQAK